MPAPTPLSVIATATEESLSSILAAIHGAGLGATARVIRPRRLPIATQLERAGIPLRDMPPRVAEAHIVLLVHAAGRSRIAADLARQHEAGGIWIIDSAGAWNLSDDGIVASIAHIDPTGRPAARSNDAILEPTTSPDEHAGF